MLVLGVVQMVARGIKGRRLWGKFGCGERRFVHCAVGGRRHQSGGICGASRQRRTSGRRGTSRWSSRGICRSKTAQEVDRWSRRNGAVSPRGREEVMEGKQEGREDGTGRGKDESGERV